MLITDPLYRIKVQSIKTRNQFQKIDKLLMVKLGKNPFKIKSLLDSLFEPGTVITGISLIDL